jgi:hypothetical protein
VKPKLSPANAVILIAGIAMVVGSFQNFYTGTYVGFDLSASAWGTGLFGIATVVVFCAAAMAGQVALSTFGSSTQLSGRPFGLTWDQMHLALGFQATVMMLCFFAQKRAPFLELGIGFWLMFGAAIALFVGALMRRRRPRPRNLRSI